MRTRYADSSAAQAAEDHAKAVVVIGRHRIFRSTLFCAFSLLLCVLQSEASASSPQAELQHERDRRSVEFIGMIASAASTPLDFANRFGLPAEARLKITEYLKAKGISEARMPEVIVAGSSFWFADAYTVSPVISYFGGPKAHLKIGSRIVSIENRTLTDIERDLNEALGEPTAWASNFQRLIGLAADFAHAQETRPPVRIIGAGTITSVFSTSSQIAADEVRRARTREQLFGSPARIPAAPAPPQSPPQPVQQVQPAASQSASPNASTAQSEVVEMLRAAKRNGIINGVTCGAKRSPLIVSTANGQVRVEPGSKSGLKITRLNGKNSCAYSARDLNQISALLLNRIEVAQQRQCPVPSQREIANYKRAMDNYNSRVKAAQAREPATGGGSAAGPLDLTAFRFQPETIERQPPQSERLPEQLREPPQQRNVPLQVVVGNVPVRQASECCKSLGKEACEQALNDVIAGAPASPDRTRN